MPVCFSLLTCGESLSAREYSRVASARYRSWANAASGHASAGAKMHKAAIFFIIPPDHGGPQY
jgi:hypothetical protein